MPEGRIKCGHSIRTVTSRNISFAKFENVSCLIEDRENELHSLLIIIVSYAITGVTIFRTFEDGIHQDIE